jgi:hypothetical protein
MITELMKRVTHACWRRFRKPKSRLQKNVDRTLAVLVGIWFLLLFYPEPLFAYSVTISRFTVYSDEPIPESVAAVISRADSRLSASSFDSSEDSFSIIIANSTWRRMIMNPLGARAFGTSNTLTGHTVLNRCDVSNDLCFNNMSHNNQRSLHSVIAHECTHQLLRRRLGFITALSLPTWKNEGYCEYVAGEPSFDLSRGIQLLANEQSDPSPSFQYLTYYLAVRHALDVDRLSAADLLNQEIDHKKLLSRAVAALIDTNDDNENTTTTPGP